MTSETRMSRGGRENGPTSISRAGDEQPTVWSAASRVMEVGQRLVLDRFELARLETREDMASLSRNILFILGAIPILLVGWIALMASLVIGLAPTVPIPLSMAILGLIHVAAGGVGTYIGATRLGGESEAVDDAEPEGITEGTRERLSTGDGSGE